ncbi:putative GTP pyrophosphokinase [Lachnospiraceae bacterium XBB1006]|nr:putative GTP pyrophosphokinase [Lachnospiraceae bacterium XBB1006]
MDFHELLAPEELEKLLGQQALVSQASGILDAVLDYKGMMMEYACAIREIETKIENLDTEFGVRYSRNPISTIHTRLKSQVSIMEKMARKGLPMDRASIEEHINDIAGIRVICAYIDDIYRIADALIAQDDIVLLDRKDYIKEPKPSGYRSLHLIVSVPVFLAEEKKLMKAEIQIRTIAMDFWASLEHGIRYKKCGENTTSIVDGLKECAAVIAQTDEKMMQLRKQMEQTESMHDDMEELYEKLKRFEAPF